ncbi:MAG: ASKHA domain-containing protein, partial [Planctomycetia bacterium]|nr:ASKHA domain-containing protein [Planctomycetia bacterium]
MDSEAHRFADFPGVEKARGVEGFAFEPLVRKIFLEMDPPTVQDNTADHERMYVGIREVMAAQIMQTGFRILQQLSAVLQESEYKVTVTVARRGGTLEVVAVEPGDKTARNFAAVVDVGTTTVVAHLVDLSTATTVDAEATYNSQMHFGEDYIRRIMYAEQNDAFDQMQDRIVKDVNSLIATLAVRQNIDLQDITAVMCSGNTAMLHFLLNLDSPRMGREPYVAPAAFIPPIRAAEAGIRIDKRGLLYCLPAVAAYVGSDIVAGVLATRLYANPRVCLFVDIGTNGEVVLGNNEWMVCASSSAGPAFEGSGVRHGMRAAKGAIERLTISRDLEVEFQTIGGEPPRGICGSGLLDTIAALFESGIVDRTGKFSTSLSDSRLTEGTDGKQFTLVPSEDGREGIVITQADIDNLIRSKAGIFAAISVLMDSTQTKSADLDAVYLAGGFGNFLNVSRAVTIGMLPDVPAERIRFVGNTSIAGAKMAMLSAEALLKAEEIAGRMTYFDLMTHPTYMDEFVKANFLPHTDMSRFPSVVPQGSSPRGKPFGVPGGGEG